MKSKNVESNKQKVIRFSIVTLLIALVTFLLIFRTDNENIIVVEENPPLASALTDAYTSFPVVAMVKQQDDKKTYLVLYRINRSDEYKFEQLVTTELQSFPKDIASPKNGEIGVWLKFKDEWIYYNEILQSREQKKGESIPVNKKYSYTSEPIEEGYKVTLQDNGNVIWTKEFPENPNSIQPLTSSENEWIITFADGIVILY